MRNESQRGGAGSVSPGVSSTTSAQGAGDGLAGSALWTRVAWFVWMLAGLRLLGRGFDPDELEHLHAAYCVFLGQLPYRDFFEHHAPALYWLAQPVLSLTGPQVAGLWCLRLLMWLLSTLAVVSTARIARQVLPTVGAGLVPGLLLGSSIVFSKGIEFRPDGPAMLLLVLVLEQVLRLAGSDEKSLAAHARRTSLLWVALLAGGATLFTQKAIVPIVVLGTAAWLVDSVRYRSCRWPGALVIMLAGVGVVWSLLMACYALAGGANALLDSTVFQLVRWSVRSDIGVPLRATLAADLLTWWLAAVAVGLGLLWPAWYRWRVGASAVLSAEGSASSGPWGDAPSTTRESNAAVPCLTPAQQVLLLSSTGCVASLAVVKATFPQYYLLWFPWWTLAAGLGLSLIVSHPRSWLVRLAAGGGALLLAGQLAWLSHAWLRQATGPFPHLTGENPLGVSLLAVGLFWLAWSLGWRGLVPRRCDRWLAWGGALALGYGVCRQLDQLTWSNTGQVAAIGQLQQQVPPGGRVLDGFTGWGALRPHAYRIWWLNEFSLGLVPAADLERELLELFDRDPPEAVLDDESLQRLPRSVRRRIEADYEPVEPAPLRLRREVPQTRRQP